MKQYYATLLIITAIMFSGCFKQDFSDCAKDNNCVLKFELKDENGMSLFAEKVNTIDAVLFDVNHKLVDKTRVQKTDLNEFPGISFTVEPGEYSVVCWGNICENSNAMMLPGMSIEECYVETISDVTGSQLYYGPAKEVTDRDDIIVTRTQDYEDDLYSVKIPGNTIVTKEILFTRAHRTIKVYLKGYENQVEEEKPLIQVTNLPKTYDFLLRTCKSRKNYQTQAEEVETQQGMMTMASFNTPITEFSEDMIINVIRASDGEIVTDLNLLEWVDEHLRTDADLNEINILITYRGDGGDFAVDMEVVDWGDTDTGPEWQ